MVGWVRPEWIQSMQQAVEQLGPPIYGLADAGRGVLRGHGGMPCHEVTVEFRLGDERWVHVTTASQPQGGARRLVMRLLMRSIPESPDFPWTLTIGERMAYPTVESTRTQFRLMELSTGEWIAAGGFKKRHLQLAGSAGTALDGLALEPAAFDIPGA